MNILAFDPGGTTGWAEIYDNLADTVSTRANLLVPRSVPLFGYVGNVGEIPLWRGLGDLIRGFCPQVVVYETFRIYAHKAQSLQYDDLPASRVIGVLEFLCDSMDIPVVGQSASHMKNHRVRRVLDRKDFASDHVYDAACHGLIYMSTHGKNLPNG